jgi:ubiquinone biosynthesis protein UbiJ
MPAPSLVTPLLAALNSLLATQPSAKARLAGHAGKMIRLALPGANLDLALAEGGVFAVPAAVDAVTEYDYETLPEPNLILTPEPAALPLWLAKGEMNALFRVRGDGLLASDLSGALADFDWVLALRPWLGDIAASRVDRFLRGLGPWREKAMESAGRNLAEYVVYEQAMLADPHAVRGFIAEVDGLREAADRVEARLKLLETKRQA